MEVERLVGAHFQDHCLAPLVVPRGQRFTLQDGLHPESPPTMHNDPSVRTPNCTANKLLSEELKGLSII